MLKRMIKMENKQLELIGYPETRAHLKSICEELENKKNEVIRQVDIGLLDIAQSNNLLSKRAISFLFGQELVERMDENRRLAISVEVAKYIHKNGLMPGVAGALAVKYPNVSYIKRLVLAVNTKFGTARLAKEKDKRKLPTNDGGNGI